MKKQTTFSRTVTTVTILKSLLQNFLDIKNSIFHIIGMQGSLTENYPGALARTVKTGKYFNKLFKIKYRTDQIFEDSHILDIR